MNNRRAFIKKTIPLGMLPLLSIPALANNTVLQNDSVKEYPKIKVIFFDVNETLLDLEPLKKIVVSKLNGNKELGALWFTTMLQYSLVATASKKYFDFGDIGVATLLMIAKNAEIELIEDEAKSIVKQILVLKPHPEVKEALKLFKENGFKLISFTNSSNFAVRQQLKNSEIEDFFDQYISAEDYGKFKPDTEIYHWAARKLKVENDECMLIAAHGWDIAGALWAGWQGAFIARPGQQLFPLAPQPQINETNLLTIAKKIIASK
jgi:2-haloacid dehalogenase